MAKGFTKRSYEQQSSQSNSIYTKKKLLDSGHYTAEGAEEVDGMEEDVVGTPMKERKPAAAGSCSSRKRSLGDLKAP